MAYFIRHFKQLVKHQFLSKLIIRLRFGIDGEEEETLEEINRKFGISRETVRQLEERGIDRLRNEEQTFSSAFKGVL